MVVELTVICESASDGDVDGQTLVSSVNGEMGRGDGKEVGSGTGLMPAGSVMREILALRVSTSASRIDLNRMTLCVLFEV